MKPLKVLLLEDEPAKKSRLLDLLGKREDLFSCAHTALSANEALDRLRNEKYDLLIADVVIPRTLNGERSEQNCIDMLEELDGLNNHVGASYVLPVSAASGISEESLQYFRARPWGLIHYHEDSNQALLDIERVAEWISLHTGAQPAISACDAFIVCALENPEFSAIEAVICDLGPLEPLDDKHLVRYGTISAQGQIIKVGLGFCQRMGPVAAAILTTKVLQRLSPKLVVMAGICAGIQGKAEIGDVIAAEMSWDWQSGKYIERARDGDAFLIAPHQVCIDDSVRSSLVMLKRKQGFWEQFSDVSTILGLKSPKLVIGPVASGASVLASGEVLEGIKRQHKNVVGLDMETYSVYASVAAHPGAVPVVSLKAVCDFGNKHKDDRFQTHAAHISALATIAFIESVSSILAR